MILDGERFQAQLLALLRRFGSLAVRTDSAGYLENDGAGNLSWGPGDFASGLFDYGLITDATTTPQDWGAL